MIAKEKAEELVDKFYNTPHCGIEHQPNKRYCDCIEMNPFQAKQCALVAVDEILELTKRNTYNPFDWNEITGVRYDKFWQEVKQEIEKL
jgi:hypothetical protein